MKKRKDVDAYRLIFNTNYPKRTLNKGVLLKYVFENYKTVNISRKMKEKGDEKFFTILEKYGNIKLVLKLQF